MSVDEGVAVVEAKGAEAVFADNGGQLGQLDAQVVASTKGVKWPMSRCQTETVSLRATATATSFSVFLTAVSNPICAKGCRVGGERCARSSAATGRACRPGQTEVAPESWTGRIMNPPRPKGRGITERGFVPRSAGGIHPRGKPRRIVPSGLNPKESNHRYARADGRNAPLLHAWVCSWDGAGWCVEHGKRPWHASEPIHEHPDGSSRTKIIGL